MALYISGVSESYSTLALNGEAILKHHVRQLFHALSEAGIRWCMLRGRLEDSVQEGEVDLLLHSDDMSTAEKVLAACAFLPVPDWNVPSHRHFKMYDGASDRWLTIDIVTELSYGSTFAIRTDAAAGVLDRCRWQKGILRPAPHDEFWMLLWHCLLDKGTFKSAHAQRVRALVQESRHPNKLARSFSRLLPRSWSSQDVISAIEQGRFDALESLSKRLQRRADRREWLRRAKPPINDVIRRLTFRATHPGVIVALLAPDGAGKTTLSEGIQQTFCFPVHVTWLGMGSGPKDQIRVVGLPIPGTVLFRQLMRVWMAYLRGAYHRALGRLVIFDRYTYDQRFVLRHQIPPIERVYFEILTRSLPAPDIVFVLDLPGQVMFDRKGEWSPEYLEIQRHRFLSVANELPNAMIVDARQDADTVRRLVMGEIWKAYVARWTGSDEIRDSSITTSGHPSEGLAL